MDGRGESDLWDFGIGVEEGKTSKSRALGLNCVEGRKDAKSSIEQKSSFLEEIYLVYRHRACEIAIIFQVALGAHHIASLHSSCSPIQGGSIT
jgi:hypothetical protein